MRLIRSLAAIALCIATTSVASAQVFDGRNMQLNGAGGVGAPDVINSGLELVLITNAYGAATSAWTTDTYAFSPGMAWGTSFTMHYAFTESEGFEGADGAAFVIQSGPATETGGSGGGIGAYGMPNSVGVGFRSWIYDDVVKSEGGVFSTIQGGAGFYPLLPNQTQSFFDIFVSLDYDGAGTLNWQYQIPQRSVANSGSTTLDESSLGPNARLGFTAGTGGGTQYASVTDWQLRGAFADTTPTPEPGTLGLFALGLTGLGTVVRRRRKKD